MVILGINAYHGDASAALVIDGQLVAAVEEERFNRIKHSAGFPTESIRYCLKAAGIGLEDLDHIGISRDPSAHLHKKVLHTAFRMAKRAAGFSPNAANGSQNGGGMFELITDRLSNAAKVRDLRHELAKALDVGKEKVSAKLHNVEHHKAHLASAFFVSPFDRAALLSRDGFGDFISTMWGVGEGTHFEVFDRVEYPHSTGIAYTATTQFIGFPHYGDEGKLMGLAPYGTPRYIEVFRDMIRTQEGRPGFTLNLDYFLHHSEGVEMSWNEGSPRIGRIFSDKFIETFGEPRDRAEPLTARDEDIAASLQLRLEEVAFHILEELHARTGLTDLALAGGVALNSVMNGKVLLKTPFRRVFVQPAAGDNGTALGVCYYIYHQLLNKPRSFVMEGAYTGPDFTDAEIRLLLDEAGVLYERYDDYELTRRAAQDIADGAVTGWFQGRMEFGPRALGNRSIVADPRRADMKKILNDRIKKREPFRPFAPSILEEHTAEYFEQDHPSPTMLMVYQVREEKRSIIPAVTHVDGSGRLQTVNRCTNLRYYQLISEFHKLTGVPVVLNTSFNENEPIVCTPQHALECYLKTRMDVLYVGNYAVRQRSVSGQSPKAYQHY
jgi:carbamoyltransferase